MANKKADQIAAIQKRYDLPEDRAARVLELTEKGEDNLTPAEFYELSVNTLARAEMDFINNNVEGKSKKAPAIKPHWKLRFTGQGDASPVSLNDLVRERYGPLNKDEIIAFSSEAFEEAPIFFDADNLWIYHEDDVEVNDDGTYDLAIQTMNGESTDEEPTKKTKKQRSLTDVL